MALSTAASQMLICLNTTLGEFVKEAESGAPSPDLDFICGINPCHLMLLSESDV